MAEATALPEVTTRGRNRDWLVRDGLLVASAALMVVTLYLIYFWVPTERNLGVSQRIFYFHLPLAWLGMVSIILVAIGSAMYLITKREKWDSFASTTAELGVLFLSGLLITGVIWSKTTWGVWWTWDAKLTTTLILWFIYVGYLMVRAYAPKGSQGARYGAVVALIGLIDAPIIYMATVWWRTAHPNLNIGPLAESGGLDSRMAITVWVSLIAFTVVYVYMLIERYNLKRTEAALDEVHQSAG